MVTELDSDLGRRLLRVMYRIRRFEEEAERLTATGEIPGTVHSSIGQEASAAGACLTLRPTDAMTGYHRSHGHVIAKGADLGRLMAELMGKSAGTNRGKGGGPHVADLSVAAFGASGIVGASLPVAAGVALAVQLAGDDRVCLSIFGDGAANTGIFHETLNIAAVWRLPVVFLCENNLYASSTSHRSVSAVAQVADRAVAYGIPGIVVDGQVANDVHEVVSGAVSRARRGDGPSLVEAMTYRYGENSTMSPPSGRSEEEVDEWRRRDPITLLEQRLLENGSMTGDEERAMRREAEAEIDEAVSFARESPDPEPGELWEDLWAAPISQGRLPQGQDA